MNDPCTIAHVSKQIHRIESRIWHLDKASKLIKPYCFAFKNTDVQQELEKARRKSGYLKAKREKLKATTPRELWYPKRKVNGGRPKIRHSQVITQVMREAFQLGFNVKTIAGYFCFGLPWCYRRIDLKELKRECK